MVTRYTDATGQIAYIRISELPEEEQEPFTKWLYGQTRPLIEGLEPQDAVYSWDYDRYKQSIAGRLILWD